MNGQPLKSLDERVLEHLCDAGCHQPSACAGALLFTAWPPNWLRSAALTLAAYAFCPRELKRSYNEAVITGVGIRLSMPSSIVQRPSPESSTYGSSSARSLPSISKARAANSHSHERTTEPCIHRCAILALSSSKSEALKSEKPSAYACIIPYSTPL